MNNKRSSEVLLKVIERLFQQHCEMRQIIDTSMVDVCKARISSLLKVPKNTVLNTMAITL